MFQKIFSYFYGNKSRKNKACQLLIDDQMNMDLIEKGVLKIPFLNEDQLNALRNHYHAYHPEGRLPKVYDNIYMTSWCAEREFKFGVKEGIQGIFEPACQRIFQNFRSLNHLFIVKNPGPETTFKVHQDWNVVDETRYPSFNIWVPLYDVNEESGAMWIIPKSHRLRSVIRGAGNLFPDYGPFLDQLDPYMVNFPMKAGEALLFFHSTIHGSPANRSNAPRVVAAATVIPESAPLHIHFRKPGSDKIQVIEPKDDFMFEYQRLREESIENPPPGKLTRMIPAKAFQNPTFKEILTTLNS